MAVNVGHMACLIRIVHEILKAGNSTTSNSQRTNVVVHVITILFNEKTSSHEQKLVKLLALGNDSFFLLKELLMLLLIIPFTLVIKGILDLLWLEDLTELRDVDNLLLLIHKFDFGLNELKLVYLSINLILHFLSIFFFKLTVLEQF